MKRHEAITVLSEIAERDLTIESGNCEYMSLMRRYPSDPFAEAYEIRLKMPLDAFSKLFLRDFVENHGLFAEEGKDGLIIIHEPHGESLA